MEHEDSVALSFIDYIELEASHGEGGACIERARNH